MEKKPRKYAERTMICIAFLMMFAVFTAKPVLAAVGISEPKGINPSYNMDRAEDPYKILAVLESKNGGKKLSEKARDKIFALNEAQTRLITCLCDRIAENGQVAGGDIAYLLIMALIILS